MRITGGTMRGRILSAPKTTGTRPMTDKVRAALFNILGDIEGLTVLDAYAGTGALGFEALSRGAESVTAVESGKLAQQAIGSNRRVLKLDDEYLLASMTVETYLARNGGADLFDIVIADPPYANLDAEVMQKLVGLVKPGGLLIISQSGRLKSIELTGAELLQHREYGDTVIGLYRV